MAKTKWWVVALLTLLAVAVLAVGGYALYRIGYARGTAANVIEDRLPQRFLDQWDREGTPYRIIPHFRMREFGRGFMFLNRDLRRPALFPWGFILPVAVVTILVALVVVLAVVLLTRRKPPTVTASAPPEPGQNLDVPKSQE